MPPRVNRGDSEGGREAGCEVERDVMVLDRPFRDFRLGCVSVLSGASTGLSSVVGNSVSASAFVLAAGFDTDCVCGVLMVACKDFRLLGLPLFLGGGFDSTSTLLSELSGLRSMRALVASWLVHRILFDVVNQLQHPDLRVVGVVVLQAVFQRLVLGGLSPEQSHIEQPHCLLCAPSPYVHVLDQRNV